MGAGAAEPSLRRAGALAVVACASGVCALSSGCGHAAADKAGRPVAAAPPPRDDGQPAKGGEGGVEHAAALAQLLAAPLGFAVDRQQSLRLLLPDAARWLRVRFWAAKSLVAFRYGKDHHAVVAGFVVHVPDESTPGACGKAFEQWAQPWVDSFDVSVEHEPPRAISWNDKIVDIDSLVARTSTLGEQDEYAAAYATYPAWKGGCLVLGIAVPARNELAPAKAVRDRFVAEVLPKLEIIAPVEPKERY